MGMRINQEERDIIEKMLVRGASHKEIASWIGCSIASIKRYSRMIPHDAGAKDTYLFDAVIRMQKEGKSRGDIALALGMSSNNLTHRLWALRQKGYDIPYFQNKKNTDRQIR